MRVIAGVELPTSQYVQKHQEVANELMPRRFLLAEPFLVVSQALEKLAKASLGQSQIIRMKDQELRELIKQNAKMRKALNRNLEKRLKE